MKKRIPIILSLLLMCLAVWLLITPHSLVRGFINDVENIGYDLQLRTRVFTHPQTPDTPIIIVDIDDKSLAKIGRWPWPRKQMAKLVDKLHAQGASVLAFDIFFSEDQRKVHEEVITTLNEHGLMTPEFTELLKSHDDYFDEDTIFAKSLTQIPSILAISFLSHKLHVNELPKPALTISSALSAQLQLLRGMGYIGNIPVLQQTAAQNGFVNIYPDTDGVIRRTPLIMEYNNGIYPSLALEAVMTYLGVDIELETPIYHDQKRLEGIKLGNRAIPTNAKGQVLIPFIGRSYTFPYYSASDILEDNLPPDTLLGAIVFIGTSATGLGDLQATAIESPFPGVEIQASVANGLLKHNFSYRPAWTLGANLFLIIFFGTIAAFTFPYLGPRTLAAIIILLPIALMFINIEIWSRTGLVLSLLMPVMLILVDAVMNLLYGYLFETRKREQLKGIFGQYVPETHIDEMLKSESGFAMHGEDREMSVLFADIRGFTTISEKMNAKELVELLNSYFTPMTEIIFNNKGTIDKYVGDLIMAFWGAPLKDPHHASNAIRSAIAMQAKVNEMNTTITDGRWPKIQLGIGLNSGNMSVGDMGSQFRRNYTVLGDAVNLASRVESLTKYYGVDIMVTENTQRNQPEFAFRLLDKVRVKGKKEGVAIYEVIGNSADLTPESKEKLDAYHNALKDYYACNFDAALSIMEKLHQSNPDKRIYQLYIERMKEFKVNPVDKDWDGVYTHTSK